MSSQDPLDIKLWSSDLGNDHRSVRTQGKAFCEDKDVVTLTFDIIKLFCLLSIQCVIYTRSHLPPNNSPVQTSSTPWRVALINSPIEEVSSMFHFTEFKMS